MKECPNCKKLFSDELSYCLYDGVPLTEYIEGVDQSAPTEAAYNVGRADPTEVLPSLAGSDPTKVLPSQSLPITQSSIKIEPPPSKPHSKLPYFAIGALALACIALALTLVVMNLDRLIPTPDPKAKIGNDVKTSPMPSSVAAVNSSPSTNAIKAVNQTVDPPAAVLNPTGKWKGEWSTPSGTFLDIEIDLSRAAGNDVEGKINLTLGRTGRPDKMDKIGLSATEYVRATFYPAPGVILLIGYKKNHPTGGLLMHAT